MNPDVLRELPYVDGGFGTIVADPPWEYEDHGSRISPARARGTSDPLYPVLSIRALCELPMQTLCAPQCHLYMWCTSAMLYEALRVMFAWGFRQTASMAWVKQGVTGKLQIGMGHYVRNAHEHVLIGERGGLTGADRTVASVVHAPRGEHSVKPEVFQDLFERMSPGPRLELFARRARPGWLCWGNEVSERDAWAAFKHHQARK